MSAAPEASQQAQVDAAYRAQRLRLVATVTAAAAHAWSALRQDREATIRHVVALVTGGQAHVVRLVDAYMAAKSIHVTGAGALQHLDPARYTTDVLRGLPARDVYSRPFGAYGSFLGVGADQARAIEAARSSVAKLAATDLQLAQTHAARDWMTADERIVGYRRVTDADPCPLCAAAATRTYRKADLLPIHEHCSCHVEPLWGTEPVASIGTTVRVELDPELGPRLMADDWSPVGPRL